MGGYTTDRFNDTGGKSGKAGIKGHSGKKKGGSWLNKVSYALLAATALCGAMQLNYEYYDYKGRSPLGSASDAFNALYYNAYRTTDSPVIKGAMDTSRDAAEHASRGAAKIWAGLTGQHTPVTLLPDHVTACIPNELVKEFNHPAAGSPMAELKRDFESLYKNVAQRHAEPGITYAENENHGVNNDGDWLIYLNKEDLERYENGQRPEALPINSYHSTSMYSKKCGQSEGHDDGAENYTSLFVTHDGTIIPAPK